MGRGGGGVRRGRDRRLSSSVSPTHSPEQSGAGLSAGAHADLLKLPAVRHRGDHLGQLLLLALQHSVNMLGRHLLRDERGRGGGGGKRKRKSKGGRGRRRKRRRRYRCRGRVRIKAENTSNTITRKI